MIPPLGGTMCFGGPVNEKNESCGYGTTSAQGQVGGYFWSPTGGTQWLGPIIGQAYNTATGVNDNSQVAGYTGISQTAKAFVWSASGGTRWLGDLGGGASWPTGINNKGQVVGESTLAGGGGHVCIWDEAGEMTDLGFGNINSSAHAMINDLGQVLYQYNLWDPVKGLTDLRQVKSQIFPRVLSDTGVVGGEYLVGTVSHPFIWREDIGLVDLISCTQGLTGTLDRFEAMNDNGQIVLGGWPNEHYLLTPVPEPGTMAILALGGMMLRRRQKARGNRGKR
jgi:probable HAF family extracellular repeat protein